MNYDIFFLIYNTLKNVFEIHHLHLLPLPLPHHHHHHFLLLHSLLHYNLNFYVNFLIPLYLSPKIHSFSLICSHYIIECFLDVLI